MRKIFLILIIALAFFALSLTGCDNDGNNDTHTHEWEWKVTTPATPTADGLETETCKTCGAESGNTRIIEQTEPTVKTFSVSFNFAFQDERLCNATIKDERTACGKQNLEQLGIKTIIEQAIQGAFNDENTTNPQKTRFRNVFGATSITLYVDNPATPYKIKAIDSSAIYFHIDYLKSTPADIQQNIINAVVAMNPTSPNLPYNAE